MEQEEGTGMMEGTAAVVTTELGMEVPVQEPVWREHTAERFLRDDPDGHAMVCHLIRTGLMNQSELKRLVDEDRTARGIKTGVSRNTIAALMMSDAFAPGEIQEIIARSSAVVTAQGMGKMSELIDGASVKDLGGVAMAVTTAHNIKQLSTGGPTAIVRKETYSVDSYEEMRRRLLAERAGAAIEVVEVKPEVAHG